MWESRILTSQNNIKYILTSNTQHSYYTRNSHDFFKHALHLEALYKNPLPQSEKKQFYETLTLTIREHREKNSDEMTAMKSPKWGRAHIPFRPSATSCCVDETH